MKEQAIQKLQNYNKENSFKVVVDYIIKRVQEEPDDSVFVQNICNEKKSVEEMTSYILQEAKKRATSNAAMFEDSEVYGWAVHYFDALDLVVERTPIKAQVTVSNENSLKNEKVNKDNKRDVSKKDELYGNTTLFDF